MSGACSTERACNRESGDRPRGKRKLLNLVMTARPGSPRMVGPTKHQRDRREFYQSQSHFNAEARGTAEQRAIGQPDDLMQLNLRTAHLPRRGAVPAIQFGL
jgi:hypothetical protein